MKALIIGGGSIGTRHLNNLKTLGLESLAIVEPNAEQRQVLCESNTILGYESLEQGLAWNPDFVVIATPNHLHIQQALKAAQCGCHLFIEKPLASTDVGLNELWQEVERRKLISLVGCNMRFHPGPVKVKELLAQDVLGKILFARIYTGSYLPDWRPQQDYSQSYSANAAMGGGCLLDCIHEIDLTRWYLGEVETVLCVTKHSGTLEIDVEDIALLICQHQNGSLSEIHLDYVQRTYERGCHIVGEKGSIFWDFGDNEVRWFDGSQKLWQKFPLPTSWLINQMYIDEMKHFLDCIKTNQPSTLSVPEAVKVMNIVFAAKSSARSGCQITLKGALS